jgi:hypothetical protein
LSGLPELSGRSVGSVIYTVYVKGNCILVLKRHAMKMYGGVVKLLSLLVAYRLIARSFNDAVSTADVSYRMR